MSCIVGIENLFLSSISKRLEMRIGELNENTNPLWGEMTVAQMLAHCSVTYEIVFKDSDKKSSFLVRLFAKYVVKPQFLNLKPLAINRMTPKYMKITEPKKFQEEKDKLVFYIYKFQLLGESYFLKKEHPDFGYMSIEEWNILFYKHLDHHLMQFGV